MHREPDVVKAVVAYFNEPKFAEFFVELEVPIQMGTLNRRADIVLRDGKGNFIAIAECKSSYGADYGRDQLKSYLSASDTQFGLLATSPNRDEWVYCERRGGNRFVEIEQDLFEAGILGGTPNESQPQSDAEPKSKSIRIWQYVAAVLLVGLLVAIVLLLMQPPNPVHILGDFVLIPSGEFRMGGSDSSAEIDEHPVHPVHVDAFYIDKYEVTNAQYKEFIDANPQWQKGSILGKYHNDKYLKFWQGNNYPPGRENHPVVYVSWYAAMAYAKWTGRRLPTEAEWEKAARGRLVGAKYPWGDEIDSTRANYGGELGDTKPVGSYPPNDYGLYDMAGNVMEWCLDTYDENFYNHSPSRNPIAGDTLVDIVNNFLSVTNLRVVRSGCWYNVPMHVRVADRYGTSPEDASRGRGFRCAGSATSFSK